MTTQVRSAAVALALALAAGPALAGCGGSASSGAGPATGSTTAAAATGAAPSNAAAKGGGTGPATVDATLSGPVAGRFDQPVKGPRYACGTPHFPDLFTLNDVEGAVGGSPYTLQVVINNFTGNGKQTGNTVITLIPGTDTSHSYSSLAESPTVVMTDKQSGTFDGNLRQGLDTTGPAIHVRGTFHC
jgi:hypothetical protein